MPSPSRGHSPRLSSSNESRFCDLPLEIREAIYRPLLRLSFWQERTPFSNHGFSLAILRVNRRIHDEAKRILYGENSWIRINMDYRMHRTIQERLNIINATLRKRPSDIRLSSSDNFSGTPAMTITITHVEANEDRDLWAYIISPYSLTHVARCMVPNFPVDDISQTMLKLHVAGINGRGQWLSEELLDPWRVVRGLGRAAVTGCDTPHASELAIALTMSGATVTCKEVEEQMSQFSQPARSQYEAGNFYQASKFFHEGAAYTHWILVYPYTRRSIRDIAEWSSFEKVVVQVYIDSMIGCVKCRLAIGDTEDARLYLHRFCSEFEDYITGIDIVLCNVLYAESHMIDEALNAAAYSLLRALTDLLHPNPDDANVAVIAGADQAVEKLLELVAGSSDPKHQIVKWNINNVLEHFRYGKWKWDRSVDEICSGFVGEIREIDALLPHRMKPPQEIIGMHRDLDDTKDPPRLTTRW